MNIVKLNAMNLSESFTAHQHGIEVITEPTKHY